jgi:two-component system LytT family response regulator
MPDSITAVIVDDLQESIDDLLYLLKKDHPGVEVVATALSGQEGLAAILKHKPQLLFLDVVMPGMSGFEMLELLPDLGFRLIITTSDDQYAIRAIRSSALDFLLKPIRGNELREAIGRVSAISSHPDKNQIRLLEKSLSEKSKSITRIALTVSDGVELVNLSDILYFESDGNYTTVFKSDGSNCVVSKAIGKFEEMVDPKAFFRVHHSYLINLYHIKKFIRGDGGYLVLDNGQTISVARNRRDSFLEALSGI